MYGATPRTTAFPLGMRAALASRPASFQPAGAAGSRTPPRPNPNRAGPTRAFTAPLADQPTSPAAFPPDRRAETRAAAYAYLIVANPAA